jgi:hypothetical protein
MVECADVEDMILSNGRVVLGKGKFDGGIC